MLGDITATVSDERTQQIEHWMREYASKSDAQVRAAMAGWKAHTPGYIAGELLLQRRAAERDPTRPLLTTLNERVSTIDGRLATVERAAMRSEFRTWGFWLAAIAVIIAVASYCRAYWGWSALASARANSPQSSSPGLSAGSPTPPSSLSPPAQAP